MNNLLKLNNKYTLCRLKKYIEINKMKIRRNISVLKHGNIPLTFRLAQKSNIEVGLGIGAMPMC